MVTVTASATVKTMTNVVGQRGCPELSRRIERREGSRSPAPRAYPRAGLRRNSKRATTVESAVLQERARIARDLHDSVSQTLYAITLSTVRAMRLLEQQEAAELQPIIENVLRLANAGQTELRALLTDIRSEQLPGALTAGLTKLAADVHTQSGLDVRLSLIAEPDLPAATKEALVLISREALHNAVRHASAAQVNIVLGLAAGEIVLRISDNGRGFDPGPSRPGHFGLQSMRERAAGIGATLELLSAEKIGTQVRVRIARPSGV